MMPSLLLLWSAHRRAMLIASAGLLCLALVTLVNTGGLPLLAGWSATLQMACFSAGVALWTWGMAGAPALRLRPRRGALAILLLFIVALGLRLVALGVDIRVLVDELNTIGGVLGLWDRPQQTLLWPMSANIMPYPWHYVWGHNLFADLFGRDLFGLRTFTAVLGALSVIATYSTGRVLFSRRVGWAGALVLLTFPLHLHISRLALINLTDALCLPALVAALAWAWRERSQAAYALAGLALGLCQYFYEGARLLSLPLVVAWVVWLLLAAPAGRRGQGRGLAVMAAVTIGVIAPLALTWASLGGPLAGRLNLTGVSNTYWYALFFSPAEAGYLGIFLSQVLRAFAVLIILPDQSPFYMGDTAMILPFWVPLFALGLAAVVRAWRTTRVVLIAWVLAFCLANGIFLLNSAIYSRYIGLTPALALLIGLGIVRLGQVLGPRRNLALAWLVLGVTAQGAYYFGWHVPVFNERFRQVRPYPDVDDAVLRAASLPGETQVHIVVPFDGPPDDPLIGPGIGYAADFMRFLRHDLPVTTLGSSGLVAYLEALPAGVTHAFFVAEVDVTSQQIIIARFATLPPLDTDDPAIPPSDRFRLLVAPG